MKKQISLQKLFLLIAACCLQLTVFSQYWQQKVDYRIDVTLNDKDKSLDAFEKINYYNNSPDTLHFIWFHLWPNAYKNDRTAFSDQLLENGNTKFYFSNKEERGYINRLDFKADGLTAKTEDHPQHIDIVKLILPKPLPPKAHVVITTPFHVKLPFNFSRGGYDGESFQITQWYPKPAVFDKNGWHEMPYLEQGEFYSEFGEFDVRITLPKKFMVAATGEMQKEESIDSLKTLHYKQENVHDFAWFADKKFVVEKDTVLLTSGKIVTTQVYHHGSKTWKMATGFLKEAVRFYSIAVGEYPYNTVSVVEGPPSFGGGMEYPTITVISPVSSDKGLDLVIAHEVGHNWFQGILATNERDFPWLDEGLNSFYENQYAEWKYGTPTKGEELFFQTKAKRKTDQPINLKSEDLTWTNYGLVAYHKTAEWLKHLQKKYGKEEFKKAMQAYFNNWKFKHPYPQDFQASLENSLGGSVTSDFALLNADGILPSNELKGFSVLSPFIKGSIKSYLQQPSKNILFLSPAIGANHYDKLMIGGLITNYKLPPNNFHFLLVPLYATGSKNFKWLGRLNYSQASKGIFRKLDVFLNASSFTMDDFTDSFSKKHTTSFEKFVPGIKLTFKENSARSSATKYIQWKTFFINEENFRFGTESIITGTDTSYRQKISLKNESYYINQLKFSYENYRALYPHDANLILEQSKDFVRPTITANYFFNYREGGLNVRLFAGKFFYLGEKTASKQFQNDRYIFNMTGANGYEDYTYSDYFVGRNEFEGLKSQQIMIRDGGFKVRTDLLASKIGRSDNWLAAVNFNTTIPKNINPLSVLPIKIPLRLFLDIGTYGQAWEKDAEGDRLLYDFGFHIPLFSEMINLYFPILYNKEYSDYFKSTIPKNRFFKTMSFTVNLYNKDLKKLNRELEF